MFYWKSTPKKEKWHVWFAWHPVKLEDGPWMIFQFVGRRLIWHWEAGVCSMNQGYYTREYRPA